MFDEAKQKKIMEILKKKRDEFICFRSNEKLKTRKRKKQNQIKWREKNNICLLILNIRKENFKFIHKWISIVGHYHRLAINQQRKVMFFHTLNSQLNYPRLSYEIPWVFHWKQWHRFKMLSIELKQNSGNPIED